MASTGCCIDKYVSDETGTPACFKRPCLQCLDQSVLLPGNSSEKISTKWFQ